MSSESYTTGLACENRPAAHTIAYDNDENKEHRASMSEPFRFLSLPKEIRLRIYHYLAPNTPTSPFRDDGGPCCPSILRTNRTIYEEAIVEWYSLMPYKASICTKRLRLLGLTISPDEALPWMFQAIKFLDLFIRLERVSMPGIKCESPSRHLALHQILHTCFPPRSIGAGNLLRLRIELGVMPPFFVAYKHQPDRLRRALEGNLSALRNLHGLAEASIIIAFDSATNHIFAFDYPNAPLLPWKMEFMAILRAFSNDLERSITA
ncbi:uncharacterized protein K444DRAFT_616590 [Hyaloscypha bicolor E]|uniref:F-box domain-containing protein n=1 Tax=Hyaloscypha bicolor E TaxID=1095630 RepID=A0A2J6SZ90_9HELO|nr:uncharacterized protein K444DRAFT_616590 [Hyaloscypha bicolor E]PMD56100.1 hypothetical protein K444DRAFT_616590 [Hyaloscypha bicolor E]